MRYSVLITTEPHLTNPISTLTLHIQYNNMADTTGQWGRYTVIYNSCVGRTKWEVLACSECHNSLQCDALIMHDGLTLVKMNTLYMSTTLNKNQNNNRAEKFYI
jgi:hypothetical protein